MDLNERFAAAVTDSKKIIEKPSNDTLLMLYSLYKQATEGDNLRDLPSNPLDFIAKAKFDAWMNLFGKTKESAMKEYIDLVEKLKN